MSAGLSVASGGLIGGPCVHPYRRGVHVADAVFIVVTTGSAAPDTRATPAIA